MSLFKEKRVFVDYNIIIDMLNLNSDFDDSQLEPIIDLIQNDYEVLISSEVVLFTYHFFGKNEDRSWLIEKLKDLISLFEIVAVDKYIIYKALESVERHGADFEYKVQYLTAINYNCELFLTNSREKIGNISHIEVIEL